MALTHITPTVLDLPSVTVALINDHTTNGIRAYVDSVTSTGVTAAPGDSTTLIATTEFVTRADNLKANIASPAFSGVPTTPTAAAGTSTLQIASTAFVTTANNLKANIASPSFTGVPTAATAALYTNNTQLATTAFVQAATALVTSTIPIFTGAVGGTEGGQIRLKKPPTSTIAGDIIIDAFSNSIRFFEGGGTYRGGYYDLTQLAAGAGTNLFAFYPGTRVPFAQASAPVGWVQDTSDTANNRMLRVVAGAGGTGGGVHDPSIMNVVPWHTHAFTTGGENANHNHGYQTVGTYGGSVAGGPFAVNWNGLAATTGTENQAHAHSGGTDGGSSQTNWSPRYLNLIICTKQ